jgi:hypothetical protein
MGLLAVYLGLPAMVLTALDLVPWLATQIPGLSQISAPVLTLLLAAIYLPLAGGIWAAMRAWATGSLKRMRVEQ